VAPIRNPSAAGDPIRQTSKMHPMPTIPGYSRTARRWSVALVCVLLVSLVPLAGAAMIQGRLVFKNNAPASDVAVRLTVGAKVVTPYAFSLRDGMYYLKNVPVGSYTLEIWRNRVLVVKKPLTVREPVTAVPDIKLP